MAALVITAAELMAMMKTITRGTDGRPGARAGGREEEGVAGLLPPSESFSSIWCVSTEQQARASASALLLPPRCDHLVIVSGSLYRFANAFLK